MQLRHPFVLKTQGAVPKSLLGRVAMFDEDFLDPHHHHKIQKVGPRSKLAKNAEKWDEIVPWSQKKAVEYPLHLCRTLMLWALNG